jgi:diacylglycerol kinase
MKNPFRDRLPAFKHAFEGFIHVLQTQKNSWIHSAATILVIIAAIIAKLPALHLAILLIMIGLVWVAEIFNTSIEALVDLISPDHHPLAKIAKDTGAAAVLILSIVAFLVGILLLAPPLINTLIPLFVH